MATAAATRPSGPPVLSIPCYRSASPTRVKLAAGGAATRSPGNSVSVSSSSSSSSAAKSRRSCMCSPTNHPGSFRCSLHKDRKQGALFGSSSKPGSPPSPRSIGSGCPNQMSSTLAQLVPMRSGHWARRALAPSPAGQKSLQHRRRSSGSRPRPSRLSAVSMAGDRDNQ